MKTHTGIAVLTAVVLLSVQSLAQVNEVTVVALEKMNVLYVGIDNPVQIAISGVPSDKMIVSAQGGLISGERGHYNIKVTNGMDCILNISYLNDSGDTIKTGEQHFRILKIPYPTIVVGQRLYDHSFTSRDELIKNPNLDVEHHMPFDFPYRILSFSLRVNKGPQPEIYKAMGSSLTKEMTSAITNLSNGSKLYFEDIKVLSPDGAVRIVDPVELLINE